VLFVCLVGVWPYADPVTNTIRSSWLTGLNAEQIFLVLVLLSGAIGSSLHAARSFAAFVGRDAYAESWTWWYLMRVPVGMGLALVLYLILRGGLVGSGFSDDEGVVDNLNPFGLAGLSALAGMFAKSATAKMEEIFETMFRTRDDAKARPRTEAVVLNVPDVRQNATGADLNVTVTGENFDTGAETLIGTGKRKAEIRNPTELIVTLEPEDVQSVGTLLLIVKNPGTKGTRADLKVID
jgi:hypothetical protein